MSLLGGTANKRCLLGFDMEGTWRKCSKCLLEFPLFCLAGMAVLQGVFRHGRLMRAKGLIEVFKQLRRLQP